MKKMAIFVEGQTEQLFVAKLLREVAGENNIIIKEMEETISSKGYRSFTIINASSRKVNNAKFYVIIYNSSGDSKVQSDIRDNYDSLVNKGHEKIVGLRDVYPTKRINLPELQKYLNYKVKTKPIKVDIILAIMEIEAWFLAETTHFQKIDTTLSLKKILNCINFDPTIQNVEDRDKPSDDLHNIYHTVGFAYTKKKNNCVRTINALDYNQIYLSLKNKVMNLGKLIEIIDSFLAS
ncbi:MAG: DUF4276 family protein [Elusimicrobia bacterium]|nr:DUF4276 family protein [Elusimicrobiota bacterium]